MTVFYFVCLYYKVRYTYDMTQQENHELKLTFCGGAGSVTGANFLLESEHVKYLIDCGLTQGSDDADETNWVPFIYDPKTIDILFVTHAHIDHIGRIPKLLSEGFKGRIISTRPTKELALPMLLDTVSILGRNKEYDLADMYNEANIKKVFENWDVFDYHDKINLEYGFQAQYLDAGHILGSGMLQFIYNGKKILFTGDLGNSPSPILCDTEVIKDIDFMLMESVYGDRNHESRDERKKMLEDVIEDNYKRKGTLIMPMFSLERTQEILFEINDLVENKRVPEMPIYLDSPLGIKLTTVYRNYPDYLNSAAQALIKTGDDIFSFPGLRVTQETTESKAILGAPNPKIIIAGSGMSNGGRILHHEQNYLPDPNNIILLTGYQSVGTIGRDISEGLPHVRIHGQDVAVKAQVRKISGYSGHKDRDHLIEFVESSASTLKKVYVAMGEPSSSQFLAQRLRDFLGIDAEAAEENKIVILDCN